LIPNFENEDDLRDITECLLKRGFRQEDIIKVLGGNFLRHLRAVLKPRSAINRLGLPAAAINGT
jgi:microsomal dipeptidase-like Zn-dependent dipeptidase